MEHERTHERNTPGAKFSNFFLEILLKEHFKWEIQLIDAKNWETFFGN